MSTTYYDPNRSQGSPQPKTRIVKKKKFKPGRFILALLIFSLIPLIGYGAYYAWQINHTINAISDDGIKVPEADLAKNKPLTILLLGKDSRPESGTLNTDVIMAITMNPDTKKATLVSLPRDAELKISDYSSGHKANWFYAAAWSDHDGQKEPIYKEMKHVFEETFEVPIDYIVMVDFKTVQDVVDAVGGIKVKVDQDMRYVDPTDGTNINLKKGTQVLDGKNALDFVRYRKSNMGTTGTSDEDRNVRQQQVISALLNKIKSPSTLLNGGGIFTAINKNIETDLPSAQIYSLIKTYAGIAPSNVKFIPIGGDWISPFVVINQQEFADAKAKLKAQLVKVKN
jgi:LCP family protein required for cell wall assembly